MFIGGMAEAKSKGRGEECISQNLRILRGQNGKRIMLFFANSQRKELKRYVSIPCTFHLECSIYWKEIGTFWSLGASANSSRSKLRR